MINFHICRHHLKTFYELVLRTRAAERILTKCMQHVDELRDDGNTGKPSVWIKLTSGEFR